MMEINPKYKYSNADKPRLPNNAFYFTVNNTRIRVCKTFYINTLGISDRQIRTVKKKLTSKVSSVKTIGVSTRHENLQILLSLRALNDILIQFPE